MLASSAFRARARLAVATRQHGRRFLAQAAAAAEDVQSNIQPNADRPTPDRTPESSAALVSEHAPYMMATYARPPPVLNRGLGSHVWDLENKHYLDFTAGIAVNGLGHCDPGVKAVIVKQVKKLMHCSNLYYNPEIGQLSKLLVEVTRASGGMHDAESVFVCNSGTEANEAALKFARKVGKLRDPSGAKHEIVSFGGAFHGRTMGALSATPNPKYQTPFAPLVPGFRVGELNNIAALESLVTEQTCGVIVEPIQGEGGVRVAEEAFLVALAKRCREVGAVLHYDEIQCGLGRTGTFWAHASLPKEAHPDIVTTAKALGNGIPIGAAIVNKTVADAIKVGDHGTTFGGNPLACAVANHVVTRLSNPNLLEGVTAKSAVFVRAFAQLRERFPELITEIRGRGLLLGVQLTEDPGKIVTAARERGLLIITAGTNTLRFVPSLNIKEDHIMEGMRILEEAIVATRA